MERGNQEISPEEGNIDENELHMSDIFYKQVSASVRKAILDLETR